MTFIDIRKIFSGLQGHLIHTVRVPADELVSNLEHVGFTVFIINGSVISDKASFFLQKPQERLSSLVFLARIGMPLMSACMIIQKA